MRAQHEEPNRPRWRRHDLLPHDTQAGTRPRPIGLLPRRLVHRGNPGVDQQGLRACRIGDAVHRPDTGRFTPPTVRGVLLCALPPDKANRRRHDKSAPRICDNAADQTPNYLSEVTRVERFARAQTGFAYPSWGREGGFSWNDASDYYQTDEELSRVPNSSKSKKWRCRECDYVIKSAALLKKCPLCKKMGTLAPASEDAT